MDFQQQQQQQQGGGRQRTRAGHTGMFGIKVSDRTVKVCLFSVHQYMEIIVQLIA